MATRSPKNERSVKKQTGDAIGATRKGASRAKPTRVAAATVRQAPSKAKASNKAGTDKATPLMTKAEKREARRQENEKKNKIIVVNNILLGQNETFKKRRLV